MKNYTFAEQLHEIYTQACQQYAAGKRGSDTFFNPTQQAFLAANGLTAQHVYDYAEDDTGGTGPGWDKAIAIESVRRDYFRNVQGGQASKSVLDEGKLPGKAEAIKGISWLPRLIPKAKAKLRGELPTSLMYCCGGDRRFFQEHDISPAEFLSLVWRNENNDGAIVDWVVAQSAKK